MSNQCPFCNEWVSDWLHCCEGKHRSNWIEAEYQTMGWDRGIEPIAVEPLIDTKKGEGLTLLVSYPIRL